MTSFDPYTGRPCLPGSLPAAQQPLLQGVLGAPEVEGAHAHGEFRMSAFPCPCLGNYTHYNVWLLPGSEDNPVGEVRLQITNLIGCLPLCCSKPATTTTHHFVWSSITDVRVVEAPPFGMSASFLVYGAAMLVTFLFVNYLMGLVCDSTGSPCSIMVIYGVALLMAYIAWEVVHVLMKEALVIVNGRSYDYFFPLRSRAEADQLAEMIVSMKKQETQKMYEAL